MLHSGHLVITDTVCSDCENHVQTLAEKPLFIEQLIADTCYNGHFFPTLWPKINLSVVDISEIYVIQSTPGI